MTEKFIDNTSLQESEDGEKKIIIIPSEDYNMAIANAIEEASEPTVLIVDTEAKKELALIAAKRMGKEDLIVAEIEKAE